MILAADIGGTKTRLGLFDAGLLPVATATAATRDFATPTDLIAAVIAGEVAGELARAA